MPEADDQGSHKRLDEEPVVVLREGEEEEWEIAEAELPVEVQQRLKAIQRLLATAGTNNYGKEQQRSAKELGMSVRSLQRLVKRWRESGLAGLKKQERSDRGVVKISSEWQKFVIKTYREGNRGSRCGYATLDATDESGASVAACQSPCRRTG